MNSRHGLLLLVGILLAVPPVFSQPPGSATPVELPSTITLRYPANHPTECYRVPRPDNGGITATVSGPGVWDVCIDDRQCPSSCPSTGQRTATIGDSGGGRYYFVRVFSRSPGLAAILSIDAAAPAMAADVTGTWTVVMRGQVTTTLTLEQSGESVTGHLTTTDGTPGLVTGKVTGTTLTLSRNTGRNTIQHYQVMVQGDSFSGTFRNEGRFSDSGAFTGTRPTSVAGTWSVVFRGQVTTTLTLQQSGETVTGNLVTTDGTPGFVTGKLVGSTLTLSRDTGRNTIQHYEVTVQGRTFSGTFRNQGRIADSGMFTGSRVGPEVHRPSRPELPIRHATADVRGVWTVTFKGQVTTTMTLEQSGDAVTGNLVTMDGAPSSLTGKLEGSTLILERRTDRNSVQHFQVAVQGDTFSGTFRNEGRFADSGTFTGSRAAAPGVRSSQSDRRRRVREATATGTWTVVFKGQITTTLTLQQSGQTVTGQLVTTDGSSGAVSGKLVDSTLTLSRNTGMDTVQYYEVTLQGDTFSGTFRNQGKYSDSGSFTGTRQ